MSGLLVPDAWHAHTREQQRLRDAALIELRGEWRDYDAWEARDRTLLEAASLARDRHLRYPPLPPTLETDA